jgi:hypothetical protein
MRTVMPARDHVAAAYLKFAGDGVLIMLYKGVSYFWKRPSRHAEFATVFPKTQTSQQKLALFTASIRKQ